MAGTPGATASLPEAPVIAVPGTGALPQPLDRVNADRYRDIFRLQAVSEFRAADRLISELTDLSLLGNVLAARYLSPHYPPLV
jgi:hypothetical protein